MSRREAVISFKHHIVQRLKKWILSYAYFNLQMYYLFLDFCFQLKIVCIISEFMKFCVVFIVALVCFCVN
jgi:hypothetical protein